MRAPGHELLRPCRRYGADFVLARGASSLTGRMLARFNASELDRLLAYGTGPVTQPLEGPALPISCVGVSVSWSPKAGGAGS